MSEVIVVTGATGNVGGETARRLLSAGKKVRAVARTAEKLRPLAEAGAETRAGSLADQKFLADAFRDASSVFAMVPPHLAAPDSRAYQREIASGIASALRQAGVRRAVTLSSIGAELADGTGPIAGLHVLEELLNGIPQLEGVHLRAAFFMENQLQSI